MGISVTDPIGWAIARAKWITFQPFNFGKWFTLGFVAFLANLDQGGFSFNFPGQGGGGGGTRGRGTPPADPFEDVWEWISAHAAEAVLIGLVIFLVIAALWLLILWLSSRGQFMFLEAVAHNTYEVVAPWTRYKPLGNSLFAFRACLAGIGMVASLVIGGVAVLLAWPDIRAGTFGGGAIAALLVGLLVFLPVMLVYGLIDWFTRNFVTTVMYATGQPVLAAWREARENIVRGHAGALVLFLLMQIVLSIAVTVAQVLIGCLTCCIGLLPYLSSVVGLPLLVFMRAYPVYFLQQFSPRYVVITEPPPAGMGFPVIPLSPQYPYPPAQQYPPNWPPQPPHG